MIATNSNLDYPRPIPTAVKCSIILFVVFLILNQIATFIDPAFFVSTHLHMPKAYHVLTSILILYPSVFLTIYGIYTGRKWVANFVLVTFSLGILLIFRLHIPTNHLSFFYIMQILYFIATIVLFSKSSLLWFKECKKIRKQHIAKGKKFTRKVLFIISIIAWIIIYMCVLHHYSSQIFYTKQAIMLDSNQEVSSLTCDYLLLDKKINNAMKIKQIDQKLCAQEIVPLVKSCKQSLSNKIPNYINIPDLPRWKGELRKCSAIAFYHKYLK